MHVAFPEAGVQFQGRHVQRVYPLVNRGTPLDLRDLAILAQRDWTVKQVEDFLKAEPRCEVKGCQFVLHREWYKTGGLIELSGKLAYRCMRHFGAFYCDLLDTVIHEPPLLLDKYALTGKLSDWMQKAYAWVNEESEDPPPELFLRGQMIISAHAPCFQSDCGQQVDPEALSGGLTLERFPDNPAQDRIRWHCAIHFPQIPEPLKQAA